MKIQIFLLISIITYIVISNIYCLKLFGKKGDDTFKISCINTTECKENDRHSFCNSSLQTCQCMDTYSKDGKNGCKQKSCGIASKCQGKHQECAKSNCHCKQNYRLHEGTGQCEYNFCKTSADCRLKDPNSYCVEMLCKCHQTFRKEITDENCVSIPCSKISFCSGLYTSCVKYKCECHDDYVMNPNEGKCVRLPKDLIPK